MINDGLKKDGRDILSVLMIGQSNMAGRGEVSDVEPIVNDRCFMLRMGRWQRMHEPVNPDRGVFEGRPKSGISLAATFADELSRAKERNVGLIPCADGGTSLAQWMPGELIFDHAVMMTRLALRTSSLGAIIWHQGESDCAEFDTVNVYKENFMRMISEMKKQIGCGDIPLIIGEISEDISEEIVRRDCVAALNRIFREIAEEIPNCRVASAKGLALKPDLLHFNAEASREFGRRYFEQFMSI